MIQTVSHPSDNSLLSFHMTPFAKRLIAKKAKSLSRRWEFSLSDAVDVEQELKIKLWRASKKFDASLGHFDALAKTVIERQCATIIRRQRAQRRSPHRSAGSLTRLVNGGEGHLVNFSATIPQGHTTGRICHRYRSGQDRLCLKMDVALVVSQLTPRQREICQRLKHDTLIKVARDLKLPSRSLYRQVHRIRRRFAQSKLQNYL